MQPSHFANFFPAWNRWIGFFHSYRRCNSDFSDLSIAATAPPICSYIRHLSVDVSCTWWWSAGRCRVTVINIVASNEYSINCSCTPRNLRSREGRVHLKISLSFCELNSCFVLSRLQLAAFTLRIYHARPEVDINKITCAFRWRCRSRNPSRGAVTAESSNS